MNESAPAQEIQFVRRLGLWDTAFLVVGAVVGSGIFLTSGDIAARLPTPGMLLVAWAAGGLITLCGALSFGELGAMFPQAGGQYVYMREAYGRGAAFLFGWAFFWFIMCGGLAALAVAFAEFLGGFVPALSTGSILFKINILGLPYSLSAGQLVAAGAMLVLSWVNSRGIKTGVAFQNAMTIFRIVAVLALVVLGLAVGSKKGLGNFQPLFSASGRGGFLPLLSALGAALVAVFWTYDGWYSVNCTAEEIRDPERNIPRGLALGVAGVTALYVLVNVVYLTALPYAAIKGTLHVGETAAAVLFGQGVTAVIAALIMVSVFGCLNANILFGPRVFYAMARDGSFFRSMARLDPRFRVPSRALWGQAAWSAVLCLSGTYQALYEYMVFAVLVFFAATGLAVVVLRRRAPDAVRPYRTWGYPAVPLVFVIATLAIFVNIIITQPVKAAIGLVLLGAGLPAYLVWRKRGPGGLDGKNPQDKSPRLV